MFGVAIQFLDMNIPNLTYFDFELRQNFRSPGFVDINSTVVPLVQCTEAHWDFSETIKTAFRQFYGERWLCPPLGYEFTVGGKVISEVSSDFTIAVKKCTSSSTCINDTTLAAVEASLGQFRLAIPVASTIVNAANKEYHLSFFEDRNMYSFSTTRGLEATGYIENKQVETDESLWPGESINEEEFLSIPDLLSTDTINVVNDTYANVKFMKSPITTTYERSFNKFDEYFAYVGGLIGTIIGLMFIMESFSENSFSVSIGNELFTDDEGRKIPSSSFHFLYTILFWWKDLF